MSIERIETFKGRQALKKPRYHLPDTRQALKENQHGAHKKSKDRNEDVY